MPNASFSPPPGDGPPSPEILRILDANFNRAGEGLRVVEDVFRLGHDDAVLARRTKQIRHALADLAAHLPFSGLSIARNVAEDVGRTIHTPQEYERASLAVVSIANLKRTQQSLRVIEECLKTVCRASAHRAEALRYEAYQLESAIAAAALATTLVGDGRLYVLVDGQEDDHQFEQLCVTMIAAGVDWIQLRDKSLGDRELLQRGKILERLTRGSRTRWIMNDRADLALIAQAHGVHVGQDDLTVAQARRIVGPNRCIGVSTHSLAQAEQAVLDGASYLGVGPVFHSATKSFDSVMGLELLRLVAGQVAVPWFALGGIQLSNLGQVIEAGATRVAVSQAVVQSADPRRTIEEFQRQLRSNSGAPRGAQLDR